MSITLSQLRRMVIQLKETDPTSVEYGHLLDNMEHLVYADWMEDVEKVVGDVYDAPPMRLMAAIASARLEEERKSEPVDEGHEPHEQDVPPWESADAAPDVASAPAPEEAEEEHKEYEPSEVRTALVAARRKGTNVTELLKEMFGVDNFTAVPASRYWELMERLE